MCRRRFARSRLTDSGVDPDEIVASLARGRARNVREREEVIERMAAWIERGGENLQ
jgi:hypothetical protein